MTTAIQDDLTILSRPALKKVNAKENLGLTDDDIKNLTPDEIRDRMRQIRIDMGLAVAPKSLSAWKIELPVVPIRQLGRDCYVSSIKYRDLQYIDVDAGVQRDESKRRVPQIASYVLANDGYFGAAILTITGSSDGKVVLLDNTLIIEEGARIVVNDGQHRIAGIRKAIDSDPAMITRRDDDLPVLIYADLSQNEQRQLFSDVNLNAAKPNRAVALNYNTRDLSIEFAKDLIKNVPVFSGNVSFVKTKIGKKDAELFTFASIVDTVTAMFDNLTPDTYQTSMAHAVDFWVHIGNALGGHWTTKDSMANSKVAMVALSNLYGFKIDYIALKGLDWSNDGVLAQAVSNAGGTNAAVKSLHDLLANFVVLDKGMND